jgi:hypothetical protein
MFGEWPDHTSLWNINHAGNEAKVDPLKDFLTVNVTETGNEAWNPASYMMMIAAVY